MYIHKYKYGNDKQIVLAVALSDIKGKDDLYIYIYFFQTYFQEHDNQRLQVKSYTLTSGYVLNSSSFSLRLKVYEEFHSKRS